MTLKNSTSWMAIAGAITVLATPAMAQQAAPVDQQMADQQATDQDGAVNDAAAMAAAQRRAAITGERVADSGDEMIVVTGTRINRPNMASAAPITSVTMQDIQAQAPVSVEEVLNRLPQIAPDSQQNYQDSDGRQRIKLRSLGFERTLVLIDGKRLGTQNGQDTGIIPTSLLQRIDVLSGGASSVYGSDAVSGVVNFVLRQDFEGLRLDGNYNFYNHMNKDTIVSPVARASAFGSPTGLTNDGGRADLTVTAGKKLFGDRLSVSAFFNYRSADKVNYVDRSSSACQLLQSVKDGPLSCSLSTYSVSGYVSPRSGPNSGRAFVNNPDGTRTFVPYGVGANNAANPFDDYPYQRELNRYTAGGFASLKITPEAELYGSAIWFKDKSYQPTPARVFSYTVFGSDPYRVNCNNPFLSASQATAICGTAAGTATTAPLDVRYRFGGLDNVATEYVNSAIRATGGIRGQVGEAWNYDVGGVYSRNKQVINYSPYADPILVNRALNVVSVNGTPTCASVVSGADTACVPFDAFSAGNSNATLLRYLLSGQSDGAEQSTGSLYNGLATVTGDLTTYGIKTPWAEQGLAVSLGTEFREDRFASTANETFRAQNGGTDANLKQHVWESNIEVQAPLVQRQRWMHLLQVNGGYRVSKYSTNPDKFTTWKVEGLFAPVDDVTFRASFNKAQRAPTVIEIRQATNISFSRQGGSQNDFCAPVTRQIADPANPGRTITTTAPLASREICRATGLSDALYGSATLLCPNDQCTVRTGGFTADPEDAYTQTYGLVLKPSFLPGLVFSVDRYRIKINNSLGYNDDAYYTDGCLRSNGDPFFCSGIVRAANGTLSAAAAGNPTSGFIRAGTTNYYFSIARGWDFQGQYTQRLGGLGRLDFGFNGSLTTFAGSQDSPLQPQRNCAGYFGNGCGQLLPKWSHGLRTTYTTPDSVFNASLNWRYVGSLTNANNSGDPAIGGTPERAQTTFFRIAPQSYFDLALTFNIARRFAFRIIANNLLDKVPPILANSYNISLSRNNTIPARYDSLGRQIAIGTTITF